MRFFKVILFCYFVFNLFFPYTIWAKNPDRGIEPCFNYYNYGALEVSLAPSKNTVTQGSTIQLSGTIKNNNTFPLVDVILYAQIKRLNSKSFLINGNHFIDKIILKDNLHFLPHENKPIQIPLAIQSTYPADNYEIDYYLVSKETFHYSGRPFLEEDVAGKTNITITGTKKADLYFDIDSLKVNDLKKNLRDSIAQYPQGDLKFEVGLIDERKNKTETLVQMKLYSFEDTFDNKLVTQTSLSIPPDKNTLSFSIKPPTPGAYVLVLELSGNTKSIMRYRFATVGEGAPELRMNDVGVTDFPATTNSRAWVCFHSPSPNISAETTITLSLYSSKNVLVDQVSLTDRFGGEVKAISLPLTKLTTFSDFFIEAIFIQKDGSRSRPVKSHYSCNTFTSSINSAEIIFDQNNPRQLKIQGKNLCGDIIPVGQNIKAFRIKQNDDIKYETYNPTDAMTVVPLNNFSPGNYNAEMKLTNNTIIKKNFMIPESVPLANKTHAEQKSINLFMYIGIICILILGSLLYTHYRRHAKK